MLGKAVASGAIGVAVLTLLVGYRVVLLIVAVALAATVLGWLGGALDRLQGVAPTEPK